MTAQTRRDFVKRLALTATGTTLCSFPTVAQHQPDLSTIRQRADWQRRRKEILAGMQLVMGRLPERKMPPVDIIRLDSESLPGFTRTKIKYLSEGDDYVPAWLLVPTKLRQPAPAMLCLHQTIRIGKDEPAGLGGNAHLHYARELALRGYVTLAPDYPYLGENSFDPYKHGYVSCTMKGIVNHRRAIDVLQSLPEVARHRLGAIGHSLGGHNTLFVAAFDSRIRAMVTSCGFTSARKYYNGDLTGWAGVRYMPLIAEKYGRDPARIPFDFPHLLVALAPRPLFINAPLRDSNFEVSGVRDCVDAARPVYERIFRAQEKLVAVYPDAGHEFPEPVREQAYEFLDRWLR